MDQEKKWMLITYYCPTHGDSALVKPIEITKKEINESYLRKESNSKKIKSSKIYQKLREKDLKF